MPLWGFSNFLIYKTETLITGTVTNFKYKDPGEALGTVMTKPYYSTFLMKELIFSKLLALKSC